MWSTYKAAAHARQHAGQYSQKRCAEFSLIAIPASKDSICNLQA